MSDCDSVGVFYDTQHYTSTPEEAAADAIKAGDHYGPIVMEGHDYTDVFVTKWSNPTEASYVFIVRISHNVIVNNNNETTKSANTICRSIYFFGNRCFYHKIMNHIKKSI